MDVTKLGQVIAVFDSGEQWADRYRIVIELSEGGDGDNRYALTTGDEGNRPNTVFMSSEHVELTPLNGEHEISWESLPDVVRRDVYRDMEMTLERLGE